MNKGVVSGVADHKTAGKSSSALLQQTTPIPLLLPVDIYSIFLMFCRPLCTVR